METVRFGDFSSSISPMPELEAPDNLLEFRNQRKLLISGLSREYGLCLGSECEKVILVYHMQIWYADIIIRGERHLKYKARYWRSQTILRRLPYDFLVFYSIFGKRLRDCVDNIGKGNILEFDKGMQMGKNVVLKTDKYLY